jgi:hypothetical protein
MGGRLPPGIQSSLNSASAFAKRSYAESFIGAPSLAQVALGHSKLSTTHEIYTQPVPAHQRAAIEQLAHLVTNGDELRQGAA